MPQKWGQAAKLAPGVRQNDGMGTAEPQIFYIGYTAETLFLAFQFHRPPSALEPMGNSDSSGIKSPGHSFPQPKKQ